MQRWPVMMAEVGGDAGGGTGGTPASGTAEGGTAPPVTATGSAEGTSQALGTGTDTPSLLDWRNGLDTTLRAEPVLQKYTTMGDAMKAFVSAEKMLGSRVEIPGADAPQEARDKFYERLGRPATPTDYQLTHPTLPEGLAWDAQEQSAFLAEAHAAGLTTAQAQAMLDTYGRHITGVANKAAGASATQMAEGKAAIAKLFGAATAQRMSEAQYFFEQVAAKRFGGTYGPEAWQAIVDSGLANNPAVIAVFSDAYSQLTEAEYHDVAGWGGATGSKDQLEARRQELLDKQFKPGGLSAQEKVEQQGLYRQLSQANGNGQTGVSLRGLRR